MPKKYLVFYKESAELIHLAGLDKAIEIIRDGKKQFKTESEPNTIEDSDYYTKKLFKLVCEFYNCTSEDLITDTSREITEARKICFSIMKYILSMQYEEIGYIFGKDESTICRGVTSYQSIYKQNPAFRDKYDSVEKQMKAIVKKQ
jgi:chromosomal replication initiation ATPase DnaA